MLSGETVMMLRENNVGFALFANVLSDGAIKRSNTVESKGGLRIGLLRVTRPDNWQTKADTVHGSFTK